MNISTYDNQVRMGRTHRQRARKRRNSKQLSNSYTCLDSREEHIRLFKWMHARGWSNKTKLKIGDFPQTGRGVYTTKNLKVNDLLIEIDTDTLITIRTINNDTKFLTLLDDILRDGNKIITSQCLFALYVLYLKHHRQYAEYIESLPTGFTVPYFCNAIELQGMPDDIRIQVQKQHEDIENTYKLLNDKLCRIHCSCCNKPFIGTIINLSTFEWAYFAVNSRSVFLDSKMFHHLTIIKSLSDKPNLALAPFLDLLNHSSAVQTALAVQRNSEIESSSSYQLYTKTSISKYQQVFISYGALDNLKLLTEYGFFQPNNKFDVFPFAFDEIEPLWKPLPYKIKLFLNSHGLDKHLNISRDHGFSHNFLVLFNLYDAIERGEKFITNDMALKKYIFAVTATMNDALWKYATKVIQYKIDCLLKIINFFQIEKKISIYAIGYVNYVKDTIEWLRQLK